MKSERNRIVSFCVAFVYIISILTYILLLGIEYHHGRQYASNRFSSVTRAISSSLRTSEKGSKEFYDTLLNSLGSMDNIASLKIYSGDKPLLVYPSGKSGISQTSPLISAFSSTIESSDDIPVKFSLSVYRLSPRSIFIKGIITVSVIFIATLICFIFTVTNAEETVSEKDENEESFFSEPDYEAQKSKVIFKSETVETQTEKEEPVTENKFDSETTEAVEAKEVFISEEDNFTSEQTDVSDPLDIMENKDTVIQENEEVSVSKTSEPQTLPVTEVETQKADTFKEPDKVQEPQGLFSPITGFGWESYLIPRLDKELIRAASGEQDLALLTIRIPGIDWNTDHAKKISKLIIDTIKFDDLVFNYKEDGCSAILQNVDTDSALVIAETLHTNMLSIFAESNVTFDARIGISTRSLRLISGERLATESQQALVHAEEDKDSPIVAFRVNPEKYRNYLASRASL